jgi:hypothetical protein
MLNIIASIAAGAGVSVIGVVVGPVVGAVGAVAGTVLAGKYIYDKLTKDQGGNAAPPGDEHPRSTSTITAHDPELQQRDMYAKAVRRARGSMQLLLRQHAQLVQGAVKDDLTVDDLRSVGMGSELDPLLMLQPLANDLTYRDGHLARANALQHLQVQLDEAHAFLARLQDSQP